MLMLRRKRESSYFYNVPVSLEKGKAIKRAERMREMSKENLMSSYHRPETRGVGPGSLLLSKLLYTYCLVTLSI